MDHHGKAPVHNIVYGPAVNFCSHYILARVQVSSLLLKKVQIIVETIHEPLTQECELEVSSRSKLKVRSASSPAQNITYWDIHNNRQDNWEVFSSTFGQTDQTDGQLVTWLKHIRKIYDWNTKEAPQPTKRFKSKVRVALHPRSLSLQTPTRASAFSKKLSLSEITMLWKAPCALSLVFSLM